MSPGKQRPHAFREPSGLQHRIERPPQAIAVEFGVGEHDGSPRSAKNRGIGDLMIVEWWG